MRIVKHALLCVAPVSIILLIGWYIVRGFLDIIPYAYGLFWLSVILAAFIPFFIQLLLWRQQRKASDGQKIPLHPSGLMIPIGILVFLVFWQVAGIISINIPSYCKATYSEVVRTLPKVRDYSGKPLPAITLIAQGKGNKKHVSFTGGSINLNNIKGIKDLSFDLGRSVFYYSNMSNEIFPLSENYLKEYFLKIPESKINIAGLSDDVWTSIQVIRKAQSANGLNSSDDSRERNFWFYVEDQNIFNISYIVTLIVSFIIATVLSSRYFKQLNENKEGSGVRKDPGSGSGVKP